MTTLTKEDQQVFRVLVDAAKRNEFKSYSELLADAHVNMKAHDYEFGRLLGRICEFVHEKELPLITCVTHAKNNIMSHGGFFKIAEKLYGKKFKNQREREDFLIDELKKVHKSAAAGEYDKYVIRTQRLSKDSPAVAKKIPIHKDSLLPQEDTKELVEGNTHQVSITRYERNQEARQICLAHYGYTCQVCGMNFEQSYGEIGKDFIEVHHLCPISKAGGEYKLDPIKDMIPLCSNCHSMVHRGGKDGMPMDIDELKRLFYENKNKNN